MRFHPYLTFDGNCAAAFARYQEIFGGPLDVLTMAEAPQPWGPWHVFHRAQFFPEIERSVFQWDFAPKWFRNGGRDFTLIFSGKGSNDSFNTIDGTFATQ